MRREESKGVLAETEEELQERLQREEQERREKEEEEERREKEEKEAKSRASRLCVLFVITPKMHKEKPQLAARVRSLCASSEACCEIVPSCDVLVAALAEYANAVHGCTVLGQPVLAEPDVEDIEVLEGEIEVQEGETEFRPCTV